MQTPVEVGFQGIAVTVELRIRLALPDGREVNIGRTAQADERYSDLTQE
jgi:hypothetical protein